MTDPLITIITPCVRFDNLNAMSDTVPDECQWIIVADAESPDEVPAAVRSRHNVELFAIKGNGRWGNPQRNLGLAKARGSFVYFLDDDNVVHPRLFAELRPFLSLSRVLVVNQVWPDGTLRLRASSPVKINYIDTAQIIVPTHIAVETPWHPTNYGADGQYFRGIWERHSHDFVCINRDLCYYNFLRPDTPVSRDHQLTPSGQQRLEAADRVRDQIGHTLQRLHNRVSMRNLKLGQRYIKGELEIMVRLVIDGNTNELVARYQGGPCSFEHETGFHDGPDSLFADAGHVCAQPTELDGSALVNVVQAVNTPQAVVSSKVRLSGIDDSHHGPRQALYLSLAHGWVFVGTVGEGKPDVPAMLSGISHSKQLPCEPVQSTSQDRHGIPNQPGDVKRHGLRDHNHIDMLSGLEITLTPDSVRLSLKEGADGRVHVSDVLLGPFNPAIEY